MIQRHLVYFTVSKTILICALHNTSMTVSSYDIISMSKRFYVNQILLDKRLLNLLDMDSLFKFTPPPKNR